MLAYTTYSEAGGVAKTTTAANLAVAHARAGLDVLVIGLDPQDADISNLLAVDDDRDADEVDNLVRHMVNRPRGEFRDLIRTTADGVDIVPEHNMLSNLGEYLRREKQQAESMGEAFSMFDQLRRVLRENAVHEDYDILICDPPATEGHHLYNAINATRSLVVPIDSSPKGLRSVDGLSAVVEGLEEQLDITVGVAATVPNGFKDTTAQQRVLDELDYPAPVVIRERAAMMDGAWEQQCSAYEFVREHRDRTRQREIDTLAKFDDLARYLEEKAGIDAPNPPEPGDLEHTTEVTA